MGANLNPNKEMEVFKNRLSENSLLFVQKTDGGDKDRHQGTLFGNVGDKLLMIGGFDAVNFAMGERIILRMVMGAALIGFETKVVKKTEDPQIYFVQFPLKVEAMGLRKADRIQAFFPADISASGKTSEDVYVLKTRISDISSGGCCFRTKTKLTPNTEAQISFTLPGNRHFHSVRAIVLGSTIIGDFYDNRATFPREGENLPIIEEIAKWVNRSLTFSEDY